MDIRFVKDNVADFWLELASAWDGKGMTVSEVLSRGAALRFTHTVDRLRITLGAAPRAGDVARSPFAIAACPRRARGGPQDHQEQVRRALLLQRELV